MVDLHRECGKIPSFVGYSMSYVFQNDRVIEYQ